MTPETGGSEDSEEGNTMKPMQTSEAALPTQPSEMPAQAAPQAEGKRTQLKIVRENIQYLSADLGNFRRSHEASIKRIEKQVASLRSESAPQSISNDVANFRKSHETGTKRLEKQVSTLRSELATLKKSIAKDAARGHARQEATLSRILAKVSAKPKPSKPSKPTKPSKSTKKR